MSNTLQLPASFKKEGILEIPESVTIPQANSWLKFGEMKNNLSSTLTKLELNAQAKLNALTETSTIQQIQTALDEYRKLHTEMVNERRGVTKHLDNVTAQLMEFEKRVDPIKNDSFFSWDQKRIKKVKYAATSAAQVEAKNKEIAAFKTHFVNEYVRLAANYETDLLDLLNTEYIGALKAKMQADAIPEYTRKLKEILRDTITIKQPVKFNRVLITDVTEAQNLFNEIKMPDYLSILNRVFAKVDEKFSTYLTDVENASTVIEFTMVESAQEKETITTQAQETQAVNVLIASAETTVLVDPSIKAIKEKRTIVIENNANWCKKILAESLRNFDFVAGKLKTKTFAAATIKQLAEALSQLESELPGFKYEPIEK